jgi:hypothetical protein
VDKQNTITAAVPLWAHVETRHMICWSQCSRQWEPLHELSIGDLID